MIYTRHLTAREMIEDFGVPEHIARFIIALERGETEGDVIVVGESQEDSGDVVEGAKNEGRMGGKCREQNVPYYAGTTARGKTKPGDALP
jgi:hypothetical protein